MNKLISFLFITFLLASCKKSSEELVIPQISDYAPLTVGKYITYSLDSLVFINVNTTEAHRLYEVKYQVADTLKDNLGRKAFRITRSIRSNPSASFVPDNTFLSVNTGNTFEFTENNLRFLKLVLPIKDDNSWKGNSAINFSTVVPGYGNLYYLDDWDYTYSNVGQGTPIPIPGFNLSNTITINQKDVSFNLPVNASTNIASRDFSQEIYAKDIGMVYRKFIHWEYQISTAFTGFGVTLKMIDHN